MAHQSRVSSCVDWRDRQNSCERRHAVPRELQIEAKVAGFPDELRHLPRAPGNARLLGKAFLNTQASAASGLLKQPPLRVDQESASH
jgi:hypothetical protein